jgi:cell division protein ZapA
MTNSNGNAIKLTIYGTEYPIKGDTDIDYIKQVAGYVDQKMYEVERNTSAKSSLKVAILAALNIADELFRERSEKENSIKKFEDRLNRLSKLIEDLDDEKL